MSRIKTLIDKEEEVTCSYCGKEKRDSEVSFTAYGIICDDCAIQYAEERDD